LFVHGCSWHHHDGLLESNGPNVEQGKTFAKFRRNRERDAKKIELLEVQNLRVMVIWECELKDLQKTINQLSKHLKKPMKKSPKRSLLDELDEVMEPLAENLGSTATNHLNPLVEWYGKLLNLSPDKIRANFINTSGRVSPGLHTPGSLRPDPPYLVICVTKERTLIEQITTKAKKLVTLPVSYANTIAIQAPLSDSDDSWEVASVIHTKESYYGSILAKKFNDAKNLEVVSPLEPGLVHGLWKNELWRWWCEQLTALNINTNGEKPAPHKPLLVLYLLQQALEGDGAPDNFPFNIIKKPMVKALERFNHSNTHEPKYPFWHMRNEAFWELEGPEIPDQSYPPKVGILRTLSGRVTEPYWSYLKSHPVAVRELAALVAQTYWDDPGEQREVLTYFGFEDVAADADSEETVESVAPETNLARITHTFRDAVYKANLRFDEDLVRAFVASLVTRRFAILTGLSGSGKTRLAMALGQWFGQGKYRVVAVRPDWTSAEAIFGYEDALAAPDAQGRRAWHVPDALAFMLAARDDPAHPYLLVLDEMNLAHVERYFADALSGMESNEPVLPDLTRDEDDNWRIHAKRAARTVMPDNLFIVGTVNVDETTTMFSPKVLDRANTLEFRVNANALSLDIRPPEACKPGKPKLVAGLLAIARDPSWHLDAASKPEWLDDLVERLRELHRMLDDAGFAFGHRVFFEAVRFATLYHAAGEASEDAALDRVVLQKMLPRIHGARRRIEPILCALAAFCNDPNGERDASFDPLASHEKEPTLQHSFDKLQRMTRDVRANQFASFSG